MGYLLAVCLISLGIRQAVPLWVIGNAAYDDQLFVRHASFISDGAWLGPFDQLTLAKGPAYPVFLAVVRRLGLPTALAYQVLALAAAGTLAYLIARLIGSRYVAAVAFTALALNPVFFGPQASRLARDNVYASTSLLVFAVVGLVVVSATRPIRQGRRRSAAGTLALAIFAGTLLAGYWLLREERSWLLPALTVLIVGLTVAGRRIDSRGVRRVGARRLAQSRLLAGAAAVIVTGAVFGALTATVSQRNHQHYGVALTNDFVSGNFPRAYGLWQSVDAGPPLPYVPISRAQRLAVYRVSVAAAELQSSMEGPEQAWIGPGCGGLGVCDDIAGGWTPWAVRDAASRAGYYRSAPAAQAFFGRLGDEIAAACASGRLRCHTPMPSMLPTPASVSGRRLLESAWRAARDTVGFQLADGRRAVSNATPEQWTQFRRVTTGLPSTLAEHQADERTWLAGGWPVDALRVGYRTVAMALLPLALVGYVVAPWRRPHGWAGAWVVGAAAAVAVLSRIGLLALVDSTSFPAIANAPYSLPAPGFLIVAGLLGLWLLSTSCTRGHRPENRSAA
jgi:hypothetical protein